MSDGRAVVGHLYLNATDPSRAYTLPREVELYEGDSIRIGRLDSNDIVIPDQNVSRFHAVVNAGERSLFLTDLASMNGTLMNGQRISMPVRLSHHDIIEVVGVQMKLVLADSLRDQGPSLSDSSSTQALAMRPLQIVALVADVNGYTKMSEALPEVDVSEMLDCWLDLVARVVKAHGGAVDKIQGDSLLGIWRIENGPLSEAVERYSATEALSAALEMQSSVKKICELGSWRHQVQYPWRFKVSIHRGEVLEGVIGRGEVREFTLVGDTVNVAFRLNELAHSFQRSILFSKEIASFCEAIMPCELLGTHPLDGRKEPIEVYSIGQNAVAQNSLIR